MSNTLPSQFEMPLIRGKVARILNSREVAINRGSKDRVREGMYFDILDPVSEDIQDPDTGEVLGSVSRPKVRVKVTRVEDRLCVASTYKSRKVNIGGTGRGFGLDSGFARSLLPPEWVVKHETLKTKETTWESLDEEESYVKTGDPVVQVNPVEIEAEETG